MARKYTKRTQTTNQQAIPTGCTALYIRVSTEKQADEGFSLDAQRQRLDAYCMAQGWNVCPDHIYVDGGASGKNTDRAQFQRMMHAAQEGQIERIVAIKLDRLARNTRDFLATVEQLTAAGCDLVLIKESFDTGTPHGKFALTMFAAIAELEASQIQERTMAGRQQKARNGGDNGRATPLGYTHDGQRYHVEPTAAEAVQSIFQRFNAGASLTAIAADLNTRQVPTARGGKWYPATVRYILTNGFYAGLIQYAGEDVVEEEGQHDPIITRRAYEDAQLHLLQLRPGPVAA